MLGTRSCIGVAVGLARGESREESTQLRVHRSAVIALHEVLDQQLPVGPYIIGNCLTDFQFPNSIASERLVAAKALDDLIAELGISRLGIVRQVRPEKAFPGVQRPRE